MLQVEENELYLVLEHQTIAELAAALERGE